MTHVCVMLIVGVQRAACGRPCDPDKATLRAETLRVRPEINSLQGTMTDLEAIPSSVATVRPTEDAGATSSGYYEFQYGWVARHALEMTDEASGLKWILCEWHTDFVLGWADSFAPVSVKHREPNSGHWTIATMFSEGGLHTLYTRWCELGRPPMCRWVTNGGLNAECRKLQTACASTDAAEFKKWFDKHGFRFDTAKLADAVAFLTALRIDNDSSRSKDQRIIQIDRIARPALRGLGLSAVEAAAVYDSVVGIARTASQGFGGTEPTTWSSSRPEAFDAAVLALADSEKRVIRAEPIREVARELCVPAAALPPPVSAESTTLTKKLRKGGVVPTADMAARRSRMGWAAYEATFSEPLPVPGQQSALEDLRSQVLMEATDAQIDAAKGGHPYGNAMHEEMRTRMKALASEPSSLTRLTPNLLMGLAYDLTAHCEIWWSERFDLDAADPVQDDGDGEES